MNVADLLGPASTPPLPGMTPAVFGLVLPETRDLVHRLWREQPDALFESAYQDRQDAAHVVFLDRWAAWVAPFVHGLPGFRQRYVTNGSSEGIRESVWQLARDARAAGLAPRLHVFEGEYEGYAAYGRAAGVGVVVHARADWERDEPIDARFGAGTRDRWYVSQPSAIDGNCWAHFHPFLNRLATLENVDVAVDLAYVGATPDLPAFDLGAPHVTHVFFSLSKVFGVFYHRVGGVLSRSPMLGLEGNRWFKNTFSLYLGAALLEQTPGPTDLPGRYRATQRDACDLLRRRHSIPLVPSEVILLATTPSGDYPEAFRRGRGFRYCLTPTMDSLLRGAPSADA